MRCLKRGVVLESSVHLTFSFKVKGLMCIALKEGWSSSQVCILVRASSNAEL